MIEEKILSTADTADLSHDRRRVTILGSTGSIGRNTLDVIGRSKGEFQIEALTAHSNVKLLSEQAREYNVPFVALADDSGYSELKDALAGTATEVAAGPEAVIAAAARNADIVVGAIVGAAGLRPTMTAVRRGATIALANKECLVCAGALFMEEVAKHQAVLLPVDSEHNAIFQVFDFNNADSVEKIILTASGGPFRTCTREEMAHMSPAQAVAHPNWDMGAKISVDSATMMNKGLEYIEAYHLFPVRQDQIDILVHPQSVIHSMVSYHDGSVLAQLGTPDMRTPISYALKWPKRLTIPAKRLNLVEISRLDFEAPDEIRFPAIRLAREALQTGGGAPTILNAANEIAVQGFLKGQIGLLDIAAIVEETLAVMGSHNISRIQDVHDIDDNARVIAQSLMEKLSR
ncbi:MAG: 1-deoxy-D-xylulose-5-phosphate reductoisomerase [Kordiimonas sp.]|nr:1-deoxy-D-xylulose-5-phosphate reductoisomerase [Kordiimonas sp.]|tara:strand:+ start:526 stop:1737 length:1212 start_codon:yes stop_codon:yes gene_type:complete